MTRDVPRPNNPLLTELGMVHEGLIAGQLSVKAPSRAYDGKITRVDEVTYDRAALVNRGVGIINRLAAGAATMKEDELVWVVASMVGFLQEGQRYVDRKTARKFDAKARDAVAVLKANGVRLSPRYASPARP